MYHAVVYYKITHLIFVPSSWHRASISLGILSVQRVCFVIYNELLFTIPEFMLMKLFKTGPLGWWLGKKVENFSPISQTLRREERLEMAFNHVVNSLINYTYTMKTLNSWQ